MGVAAGANASGFLTAVGAVGYAIAAAACVGAFFLIDQAADLLSDPACNVPGCAD